MRRPGIIGAARRAALYPARVAARASRGRIEDAADDVLEAPETARILDQALAGSLPEKLAQSIVRHHVLERMAAQLAASGELDKLVNKALQSPQMRDALRTVASSPEVRAAIARQSAGLAEEVVGEARSAAARMDDRIGRMPVAPAYAGLVSRAIALGVDALTVVVVFAAGVGIVALIGSLVGGIRPHWLVGVLLGVGLYLAAAMYFALFWSAAGQTPGMRLMRLRVRRANESGISVLRALVRVAGLAIAIIPFFAGFLPVLFDGRRRGLPDYIAGTVVVYDQPRAVNGPAIGLALFGGFLFAFGSVLQQKGAMEEPEASALRAGFLLRLLRRPIWLVGLIVDAAGYVAQAAALGLGKLVVVQPLLVSSVIFALPLGVWLTHQRVGRREIGGAIAVVAGLTAFMVVANPSGGRADAPGLQWAIAGALSGGAGVVLAAIGWRRRPGMKAALTGSAAGILFGFVAALTKATVLRFDDGAAAVFLDWHIYTLAVASLVGFTLVQVSLQTGALAPAITPRWCSRRWSESSSG